MVDSAAMKQYVIDELKPDDCKALRLYLEREAQPSGVDGLFWLPLDDSLLSETQRVHSECAPFAFALELLPDRLVCELLVRTRNRVRCDCVAYASAAQRAWLMDAIDSICDHLDLKA